ncbi:MAG: DUF6768 family protein [Pseudohongiella sp.]|uniref:DUF6768 family protein n=1 Tax=Pseudohongiella sp. TaxID=1979412 RepID=UPI0034A06C9A
MNIDEKIRHELRNDSADLDALLTDQQGMFAMVGNTFKGGLGRWMVLVFIVILLVTAAMLWCGYEFVVADTLDARIYWGVWFIVTLMAQVAMKQWSWMEARRISVLREIKRVEIAVDRLKAVVSAGADTNKEKNTGASN